MSSKGEYTDTEAPPRRGGSRSYNSRGVRRQQRVGSEEQQMGRRELLQQKQQQEQELQQQERQQRRQRQSRAELKPESSSAGEAEKRKDADDSSNAAALAVAPSVSRFSTSNVTNLDRFIKSATPFVQARYLSEVNASRSAVQELDSQPFFYLEDLWESLEEWSALGGTVPLLLNGEEPVKQFFSLYLSGIQLYIDPSKPSSQLRGPTAEIDAESYKLISSAGSSDSEGDRGPNSDWNLNMQLLNSLSLGDKSGENSATSETSNINPHGPPSFEFFEHEQPYNRRPLTDMISLLATKYPALNKCRSCDLLPSSWICVAWYPIYRIPKGSTLKELETSFLSFHSLSTQSGSKGPPQFHAANTRTVKGFTDPIPRLSLPVFALASYKLKGSLISPRGAREREQENSLFQAADDWLKSLQVNLPDYQFFCAHRR